jgi:hypothetical protein
VDNTAHKRRTTSGTTSFTISQSPLRLLKCPTVQLPFRSVPFHNANLQIPASPMRWYFTRVFHISLKQKTLLCNRVVKTTNFAAKAQSHQAPQRVVSHTSERYHKSNQRSQHSSFIAQAFQQSRDSLRISSPELKTRDPPTSSSSLARPKLSSKGRSLCEVIQATFPRFSERLGLELKDAETENHP